MFCELCGDHRDLPVQTHSCPTRRSSDLLLARHDQGMNAPLYNRDILRLAASIPYHRRLTDAQASVEKRSATCGSSVTVDVCLDNEGRVANLGLEVRACALGQASASLMAAHAMGNTVAELIVAREALAGWLGGTGGGPDFWAGGWKRVGAGKGGA